MAVDALCRLWGAPHNRHRKASIMASENISLINIMEFLGHDNIEVTQKYLRILGHFR